MINRSLLTCVLILVGSTVVAPKTIAQTVDIPFTGEVAGVCRFGDVIPGILVPNQPTNPTRLSASSSSMSAPMPGSNTAGVRGRVMVSCNQSANLTVSRPVQTGGPTFTPMFSDASVRGPIGSTGANNMPPLRLSPTSGSIPLEVDMVVDKGSPLVPGTYNYKVMLTVTP